MVDSSNVSSQRPDSIAIATNAKTPPFASRDSGVGQAVQSVAQSVAIAVQDATDNLRNSMALATTAIGVAMSQLLVSGDQSSLSAVKQAQEVIDQATHQFKQIGTDAANVLGEFRNRST